MVDKAYRGIEKVLAEAWSNRLSCDGRRTGRKIEDRGGKQYMFTGIIEEIGIIRKIQRGQVSGKLTIGAYKVLSDAKVGDSIAVNGICLTVTSLVPDGFTVDVMHETFDRSNVGSFRVGTKVNLERAMAADGRFGGHIVAGHIDDTGTIEKRWKDENAVWYEIKAPAHVMRYLVEKGSIAIDGVSLTVAKVEKDRFYVSVIPHTEDMTIMSEKRAGDRVNLENDCIGKYVEKLLGLCSDAVAGTAERVTGADRKRNGTDKKGNVTEKLLAENGFLL